jgi:predicted HAD superfamily phosphohydrolase YqeG
MKVGYTRLADLEGVIDHITSLSARTVVFDVEPLVALWDTDLDSLLRGVEGALDRVTVRCASVEVVVFATNSRRRLLAVPDRSGVRILYLAAAGKPLRVTRYRQLPRPGVVVGDQAATDGVLAWRLGFSFLHCRPLTVAVPPGPQIMNQLVRPLLPLLFDRSG